MAKKSGSTLFNIGLFAAGLWILDRLIKAPEPAGISGCEGALRKMTPFVNSSGENMIIQDLFQFHYSERSAAIRMFEDARLTPKLTMPFFKTLQGTKITAELRRHQWRVFLYKVSETEYLILSVFKKKTNETPKNEMAKAEKRLNEYLTQKMQTPGLYYAS